MNTMDLKGITWVGNIYQKFEAICLEVEETMYQDTVEYVENQVQTVGASVKRFCEDVMQDLLPLPSMDSVKVGSDMTLEQYADVGIYKKPKVCIKEEPIKVVFEQLTDNSNVVANVDKHVGHASSISGLRNITSVLPPSSGYSVKGACPDVYLGKKNGGIYKKSNFGIVRKPKKENRSPIIKTERENQPPSEMSGVITPAAKDLSRASSFCELPNESNEAACDQIIAMISQPVSDAVTRCDSEEEQKEKRRIHCDVTDVTKRVADVSINLPSSDMICVLASSEKKEMELKISSSGGGLSAESNDRSTNNGVVSLIDCLAKEDTQHGESADMDNFMSHTGIGRSDAWNADAIENNDVFEPEMGAIELIDKEKLEETCVVVDGDKFCSISHKAGKHKSYKKKIRDAFSSKMRLARKQEYEQLAAWYGDMDKDSNQESVKSLMPTPTMDSDTEKLQSHGLNESEWELL